MSQHSPHKGEGTGNPTPGKLTGRWENVLQQDKKTQDDRVGAVKKSTISQFSTTAGTGVVKNRAKSIAFQVQDVASKENAAATLEAAKALAKTRILSHYREAASPYKNKTGGASAVISGARLPSVGVLTGKVAAPAAIHEDEEEGQEHQQDAAAVAEGGEEESAVNQEQQPQGRVLDFTSGSTQLFHMSTLGHSLMEPHKEAYSKAAMVLPCAVYPADPAASAGDGAGLTRNDNSSDGALQVVALALSVEGTDFVAVTIKYAGSAAPTATTPEEEVTGRVLRRIAILAPSQSDVVLEVLASVSYSFDRSAPVRSPDPDPADSLPEPPASATAAASTPLATPLPPAHAIAAAAGGEEPDSDDEADAPAPGTRPAAAAAAPQASSTPTKGPVTASDSPSSSALKRFSHLNLDQRKAAGGLSPDAAGGESTLPPPAAPPAIVLVPHVEDVEADGVTPLRHLGIKSELGVKFKTPSTKAEAKKSLMSLFSGIAGRTSTSSSSNALNTSSHSVGSLSLHSNNADEDEDDSGEMISTINDLACVTCSAHSVVIQIKDRYAHGGAVLASNSQKVTSQHCPSVVVINCSTGSGGGGAPQLQSLVMDYSAHAVLRPSRPVGAAVPDPGDTAADSGLVFEYSRGACMSGWMTKWPMNNAVGSSTHRYFILHGEELSYHRAPPRNYEAIIASPYNFYNPVASGAAAFAGGGSNEAAARDVIKKIRVLETSCVVKAQKQLVKPCYAIETSAGLLHVQADDEMDNEEWTTAVYESAHYQACKDALATSSAVQTINSTNASNTAPTLVENVFYHHSYAHFHCVSIDGLSSTQQGSAGYASAALFTHTAAVKDIPRAMGSGGGGSLTASSAGFVVTYSIEFNSGRLGANGAVQQTGSPKVYRVLPLPTAFTAADSGAGASATAHIPSSLKLMRLFNEHVVLLGGSNGFVGACYRPANAPLSSVAGSPLPIATLYTTVPNTYVSKRDSLHHDASSTITSIATTLSPGAAAGGSGEGGAMVFASADNHGGIGLWSLEVVRDNGSAVGVHELGKEGAVQQQGLGVGDATALRPRCVMQAFMNINDCSEPVKRHGFTVGSRGPSGGMGSSRGSSGILSVQFIYGGHYLLVSTTCGKVRLLGVTYNQHGEAHGAAGDARSAAKISSILSPSLGAAGNAPAVSSPSGGGAHSHFLGFTSWGNVDVSGAEARDRTHSGHTPPSSLASVSGGAGLKFMYALSVEPYRIPVSMAAGGGMNAALLDGDDEGASSRAPAGSAAAGAATNTHNIRQRVTCWKVTVTGNRKASVECTRMVLSENVLQQAIAKAQRIPEKPSVE